MKEIKYLQNSHLRTIYANSKKVDSVLHLLALLNYKLISVKG